MSILVSDKKSTNQSEINGNITEGLNLLENLVSDNKNFVEHTKLVEHHIKYMEIDGVDETVFMNFSEHIIWHNKYKIHIPPEISRAAYERTEKRIAYLKQYHKIYAHKNRKPGFVKTIHESPIQCPLCKSDNTVKSGKCAYNNKKRYKRKDCKRYFTSGCNYRIDIEQIC